MMVTFISQCEKKALKKTRRVLDAFANRIGDNTWQTVITEEGLKTVKKLLRQTASKSTAVSCHWIRSRSRSQFLWVVGNKRKFDEQGVVPVNSTQKAVSQYETDWHYLPLIKVCVALAALFHDWGKAWDALQNVFDKNLAGQDHVRHEFVSLMLFAAIVNDREDNEWLYDLQRVEKIDEKPIIARLDSISKAPFKHLPGPLSQIIGWLILGHHLLPEEKTDEPLTVNTEISEPEFLKYLRDKHGYLKLNGTTTFEWVFSGGLPFRSPKWNKQARKWADRAFKILPLLNSGSPEDLWRNVLRPVSHLARAALMVGDHLYSSKSKRCWEKGFLLAKSGDKPQWLDEHLVGVMKDGLSIAHFLPYIEQNLGRIENVRILKNRTSQKQFTWQDKSSDTLKKLLAKTDKGAHGIFVVNMASTGTGKTFGNAKIMYAIQNGSLRYTLALGLRSLTLQTGDEYRERIKLDDTELAVVIGSAAVRELHDISRNHKGFDKDNINLMGGWDEVDFSHPILDEKLTTVLNKREKACQILYSPILVCTIDHIMGATEGTKRGRQILPLLRLLSADLVIDEVDDFDGDDLVAIMRLVHLTGMLGRNIVISSATIPPAVAESAFNSYMSGWKLFAYTRKRKSEVLCAWVDEITGAKTEFLSDDKLFKEQHEIFIRRRLTGLQKQRPRRKTELAIIENKDFAGTVVKWIERLHNRHAKLVNGKKVSFGVVRMANITPCVMMARFLLNTDLPENIELKALTYHSRFPLLIRNAIEAELDITLKRKNLQDAFESPNVKKHIEAARTKNVIFVVVATPVEEVGRDHDFDWAILEPSSVRSLVQMAGRVLRHRHSEDDFILDSPNVVVLNQNLRALKGDQIVFRWPGYECKSFRLKTHDVGQLLNFDLLRERVDSGIRIIRASESPLLNLSALEHAVLDKLLLEGMKNEFQTVPGWNNGPWHLSSIAQQKKGFRQSSEIEEVRYLMPDDLDLQYRFYLKSDNDFLVSDDWVKHYDLNPSEKERLWVPINYQKLLEEYVAKTSSSPRKVAERYGMISIKKRWIDRPDVRGAVLFNENLGVWEDRDWKIYF